MVFEANFNIIVDNKNKNWQMKATGGDWAHDPLLTKQMQ